LLTLFLLTGVGWLFFFVAVSKELEWAQKQPLVSGQYTHRREETHVSDFCAYQLVPIFESEVSPARIRGMLGGKMTELLLMTLTSFVGRLLVSWQTFTGNNSIHNLTIKSLHISS
jgi:hypothetical protein